MAEPHARFRNTTRCQPHHVGPSQAGTPALQGSSRSCSARVPAGDDPTGVDSCRNSELRKRLGGHLFERRIWSVVKIARASQIQTKVMIRPVVSTSP